MMAGSPALLLLLSLGLRKYGSALIGNLCREEGEQWVEGIPLAPQPRNWAKETKGKEGEYQTDRIEAAQGLCREAGMEGLQHYTQQEQSLFRQVLLEGRGKGREGA